MNLQGRSILITGAARRVGRYLALTVARAGGTVILHHGHSSDEAEEVRQEILDQGSKAHILQADLNDSLQASELVTRAMEFGPIFALVNNAAIFEAHNWENTDLNSWNRHLNINLTAPFFLSQAFARTITPNEEGRIINILDWRALRPGADHLPYVISKAGLAALTKSLALALAPRIVVNGLAFGAILPPADGAKTEGILKSIPAHRWADLDEVGQALIFLLTGPTYITGEIIHIDGGRHLA
jgi:NAD(P)-dependent dehydrogenase (short-subunit alcohol dehydrogenase family)